MAKALLWAPLKCVQQNRITALWKDLCFYNLPLLIAFLFTSPSGCPWASGTGARSRHSP